MHCIVCDEEVTHQDGAELEIDYAIPGDEKIELVALVCGDCGKESENFDKFIVMEMIANARICRLKNPDTVYTPKNRKDEPEK